MTVCCPTCGSEVERIDPAKAVAAVHMGEKERRVVDTLAARFGEWVSTDALVMALYSDDPNGGPDSARSVVGVITSHLRPRMATVGLAIVANGRGGRRLTWAQKASAA